MPELHAWLMAKRQEAKARGGKALSKSQLASLGDDYRRQDLDKRLYIVDRKCEEIANPITGEVVAECLSIGRLAKELGVSTIRLTSEMERLQLVHRVLASKEIPMTCEPALRKPEYFHTPAATLYGIEEGFVIPIEAYRDGELKPLILVTPDGQQLLRGAFDPGSRKPTPAARKREARCVEIARLLLAGHSQADISRITGLPKQTVCRHVWCFKMGA